MNLLIFSGQGLLKKIEEEELKVSDCKLSAIHIPVFSKQKFPDSSFYFFMGLVRVKKLNLVL
jgi:hypothetical protein